MTNKSMIVKYNQSLEELTQIVNKLLLSNDNYRLVSVTYVTIGPFSSDNETEEGWYAFFEEN